MPRTERRYPGKTDAFRLSCSTVETCLQCPLLQHKRDARRSNDRRSTIQQAIGTSVAEGARVDNEAKICGDEADLNDVVDAALTKYAIIADNEIDEAKRPIEEARDDVSKAMLAYNRVISPSIVLPFAAEEPLSAIVDGVEGDEIELVGTPDLLCTGVVRDTKTGKPWTDERAARARQFTGYSLLYESQQGVLPDRIAVDAIAKHGRDYVASTIWGSRSDDDINRFLYTLRAVKFGIESGYAAPAPVNAWWCSKTWCEEWRTCEGRPS